MREKLNSNPIAQAAVLGVLLLATGFFVLSTMGGGGAEEAAPTSTEGEVSAEAIVSAVAGEDSEAPAPGALAATAPPLPREVTAAFDANRIVVLLFVRHGGIDDRMVAGALGGIRSLPDVATFVVPVDRIGRYAAIAQGVDVNRVPALVVLRPKRLDHGVPSASVIYGFQTSQSVAQAVVDAGYKGRILGYHP
jgi:hypothetical protein